jgi:hypothetical protein
LNRSTSAVGLGPIGAGALVGVAAGGQGRADQAAGVATGVVGQHPLELDAVSGVEGLGSAQEAGAGQGVLISQDLGVGQPGGVVNRRVDVVVADPPTPRRPGTAAVDAVAATIRDAPQLLDVDMDQLTGSGTLIAADHPTRGPVHVGQPTQAVADKDAMDGGSGPADPGGRSGPGRACGCGAAGRSRPPRRRAPGGVMVGDAGPVMEAGLAVLAVASPPAVGAGSGDAQLGSDLGGRAASGDALAQD